MHFDTPSMKWLRTDWFPEKTNRQLRQFRPGEKRNIREYIDSFFDMHMADPRNQVGVLLNCPHPWARVLIPIWRVCNENEEEAAMLLGNIFCRVAILRSDDWWSHSDTRFKHKPRMYVFDQFLKLRYTSGRILPSGLLGLE